MDDEGDDDPVPLPNVNAAILKKVKNTHTTYHTTHALTYNDQCQFVCLKINRFVLLVCPDSRIHLNGLRYEA